MGKKLFDEVKLCVGYFGLLIQLRGMNIASFQAREDPILMMTATALASFACNNFVRCFKDTIEKCVSLLIKTHMSKENGQDYAVLALCVLCRIMEYLKDQMPAGFEATPVIVRYHRKAPTRIYF